MWFKECFSRGRCSYAAVQAVAWDTHRVSVPAAQFPANAPGGQQLMTRVFWTCHPRWRPRWSCDCWLWLGPALALEGIWGEKHWIEGLFSLFPPSLPHAVTQSACAFLVLKVLVLCAEISDVGIKHKNKQS